MNKKYIVSLSAEDKSFAHDVLNDPKTAKTYKKRANVLLMADESVGKPATQAEIAERCGVSDVTIYHTLRDYCEMD
jgi:transcription initiation factor TFIIIB Brf1 subunit/transcription initiation factor TFIIB